MEIRLMRTLGTGMALLLAAGCAHTPPYEEPSDPLEPVNRAIYRFNDVFDRALLKPVAKKYHKLVPTPAQTGISNFFSNLGEPVVIVNDLLQAKFAQGAADSARLVFNSTFGLAGLIDVATSMGLPKHSEDFGQTFAVWGAGEGWYLVLPFLGPSTVRDAAGLPPAAALDPVLYTQDTGARNSLRVLRAVDIRARLLGASRVRDTAALDEYLFTRAAYRQHRWSLIHDGDPPQMPFEDGNDDIENP